VAKVQSQYYERLAEVRAEIDRSLKRWGAELKELTRQTGTTEAAAARGLEEFRARIQAELTEWQPEIEQLKARAAKTTQKPSDWPSNSGQRGRQRPSASRPSTDGRRVMEEIRPAIEKAWAELRPALMSAAAKFKETQPRSDTATTESSARPEPRAARARGVRKRPERRAGRQGRRGVPRSRASMTSAPPGSRFPPHGNTMRIE